MTWQRGQGVSCTGRGHISGGKGCEHRKGWLEVGES